MHDQAEALRNMVNRRRDGSRVRTKIVTVTSGKGGVGKSNFTLNFALSLQALGYRTLVFDADIGLANIDVLMGVTPKFNLYHLLKKQKTIWEIIHKGMGGVLFIAGGSGFNDLVRMSEEELEYFTGQISELNGFVDYILFDTGAGLSKETLKFIVSAERTIVVTTPEPTAITDAYAIIKMVHGMNYRVPYSLVVNRVRNEEEGRRTAEKISLVARQFLKLDIPLLGCIEEDQSVQKAVRKQVPFTVAFPNCAASRSIRRLASAFAEEKDAVRTEEAGVRMFLNKLLKLMR